MSRIDRRTLSRASRPALERLARALGLGFEPCACWECHAGIVDTIVRKLDADANRPPQPAKEER